MTSADLGSVQGGCVFSTFSPALCSGVEALKGEGDQTLIRLRETKKPLLGSAMRIRGCLLRQLMLTDAYSATVIST